MAALSVDSGREGKEHGQAFLRALALKSLPQFLLAATPPVTNSVATS